MKGVETYQKKSPNLCVDHIESEPLCPKVRKCDSKVIERSIRECMTGEVSMKRRLTMLKSRKSKQIISNLSKK